MKAGNTVRPPAGSGPASFAATVAASAHDFRQALQALALGVGALDRQVRDPQAREALADLRLAVATVDCGVEAVTGLAALCEGQARCQPAGVDLSALVDALVARLSSERPGTQVFWRSDDAGSHWVQTDARWLERVLRQLVWRLLEGEAGERLHIAVSGSAACTIVDLRRSAAPLLSVVQPSLFDAGQPGDGGSGAGESVAGESVTGGSRAVRAARPPDAVRDAYQRLAGELIGAHLMLDAGGHRARLRLESSPGA